MLQLLQGNRRAEAQSVLVANRKRNEAIKFLEKQLIELAELFQSLDEAVVQQEVAIVNIEHQGEKVEENVAKANVEIEGAIGSARAARKKKFWCLGIARKSYRLLQQGFINLLLQFSFSLSSLLSLPSLWLC